MRRSFLSSTVRGVLVRVLKREKKSMVVKGRGSVVLDGGCVIYGDESVVVVMIYS